MAKVKDDELDQLINEEEETPTAPTAEKGTGEEVPQAQPTEEELEWSRLKGNAQDRFRQIIRERNDYREKLSSSGKPEETSPPPPPSVQPGTGQSAYTGDLTTDQKQAVETLRKFGIITRADLQAVQDQMVLDAEYQRLEGKYDGRDGLPKFDRTEIEDYMRRSGIYNPEKAYNSLYEEERFDWRVRQGKEEKPEGKKTYTEKPTSSGSKTEPLSIESIKERLSRSDGRQWWDKNREKILPILGELMGTT